MLLSERLWRKKGFPHVQDFMFVVSGDFCQGRLAQSAKVLPIQ
jgi:hypothetical protein